MKFIIKHEMKGRMRVRLSQKRMTYEQADILQYYLLCNESVKLAKVYDKTCDAVINYTGDREDVIRLLQEFHYQTVEVPADVLATSGREVNAQYQEKLFNKVVFHYARKWFLPYPLNACYTSVMSLKYIWKGIKCLWARKIEVPVLDATAIGVSVARGDFSTAGSVMFLLLSWMQESELPDLLSSAIPYLRSETWSLPGHLRISYVSTLPESHRFQAGDRIVIRMGTVIPFDGDIVDGEAMINQASLTGESVSVRKTVGSYAYAGTVVEEGEITVGVKQVSGNSRFDKIVTMIEESEKLKSGVESKAEHLADRLVPYSLGGTALTYLLTRNVTKALSILMVDFSCALKLSMPISVLSAIREANLYNITVKGGKYLEAVAEADTIVFDKTGTLTKATPTVVDVVPFDGKTPDELLRIAACLEEHFPHSMAKAVVNAAKEKNLDHEEMHSKVEYVVAHGISTTIDDKNVIIGSSHFVFEDEKCTIPEGKQELFDSLPEEYSHLYLAIENQLAGVICIEDPLREEAKTVIAELKKTGFGKIVMMTGDSDRTASAIAKRVGVDEYYSEVLPEDKAAFVEKEKAAGRKVIMIGDGINDSPALSAADVGIAISNGAEIAREIADITVGADDLGQIVTLRRLSNRLMKRIQSNYRFIVGFNSGLIVLGVTGVIQPTTSALLHNTSTLAIGLKSMKNLL